jgi:torulene dioxygenase
MITLAEDNRTPGQPAPSPVGFNNVPAHEIPIDLKVEGSIPSWVQGVLYRSGKNKHNTSAQLLT